MRLGLCHGAKKVGKWNARLNVSLVHNTLAGIGTMFAQQSVGLHNLARHVVAVNHAHTGLVATAMTQ